MIANDIFVQVSVKRFYYWSCDCVFLVGYRDVILIREHSRLTMWRKYLTACWYERMASSYFPSWSSCEARCATEIAFYVKKKIAIRKYFRNSRHRFALLSILINIIYQILYLVCLLEILINNFTHSKELFEMKCQSVYSTAVKLKYTLGQNVKLGQCLGPILIFMKK